MQQIVVQNGIITIPFGKYKLGSKSAIYLFIFIFIYTAAFFQDN